MATYVPGPSGSPVLGMLPAFRRDVLGCLLDGFHRYGDVVGYPLGPRRGPLGRLVVAAYHPDDVHRVLTGTGSAFNRQTIGFVVMTEVFGAGLLTTDGDIWLRQRRTLQPLFTPRRVAGYAALMAAEAARVVADPTVRSGEVLDLHQLMQRYTLRVVGRALFGEDVDDIVDELHQLVPLVTGLTRARAIQVARLPLGWPTPRNRRLVRARARQYVPVDRILAKRAARPAGDADDLVARLQAARDPDTGQGLSTQEIRDQVLIFLLAGHETTAGALTFTLHQLGRHPEMQDQVVEDTDFARAALLEGMRLYPPAWVTERSTAGDTELGDYQVPGGTLIFASPWVTHRHPTFWPDPGRYDPKRFLGDSGRPRYAYFPFGGGPRACIGEHFALLEADVLLRALLERYRIEALDDSVGLAPFVTLRPDGPVRATFTLR